MTPEGRADVDDVAARLEVLDALPAVRGERLLAAALFFLTGEQWDLAVRLAAQRSTQ